MNFCNWGKGGRKSSGDLSAAALSFLKEVLLHWRYSKGAGTGTLPITHRSGAGRGGRGKGVASPGAQELKTALGDPPQWRGRR